MGARRQGWPTPLRKDHRADEPDHIALSLLGGFRVESNDDEIDLPLSAQRLVAFLALSERPMLRPRVAGALWPDTVDRRARANLRSALWRLGALTGPLVDSRGTHLTIADAVTVDVRDMCARAQAIVGGEGLARDADCAQPEGSAVLLFTADLLPDWYEDWVLIDRERVRQVRLRALEGLCERLAGLGRYPEAVEVGLAAVAADPLRESAHRALIRVHVREGNHGEALRQYRLCCKLLAGLSIGPTDQTRDLMAGLLAHSGAGAGR
jgi:DNA-binding SARP family transcriptional activator